MTPAARRAEMAGNIAVLRELPPCELAERITAITGYQDTEAACWMCGAIRSVADMRPAAGGLFTCADSHENDGDCARRAADLQYEDEQFEHYAALGRGDTGGI